jgi:hypothetical protein
MTARLTLAAALLGLAAAAPARGGELLEDVLDAKATGVLQDLRRQNLSPVGVLKFTADKDGKAVDDLGELGHTLATRTHYALATKNRSKAFALLENPGKRVVEAENAAANHLTEAGRKAFFDSKFQPAHGASELVKASAFVTGLVRVEEKTLTIKLQAFDASGKLSDLTDWWAVDFTPALRGEAAKGYAFTGEQRAKLISGGKLKREEVQEMVLKASLTVVGPEDKPKNPLADCPVEWEIYYDGKRQTPVGTALPEPRDGAAVKFVLRNRSTNPDEVYAAVLLVNGESTLYKERQGLARCAKWVLPPGGKGSPAAATEITGFQTEGGKADEFKVVRPEDPAADTVRYSENLGQFRLVVFAGKLVDTPPASVDGKQLRDSLAIASARLPDRPPGVRPRDPEAYAQQLTTPGKDGANARGVVVAGKQVESKTEQVWFVPHTDQPVADITLQYYQPKTGK